MVWRAAADIDAETCLAVRGTCTLALDSSKVAFAKYVDNAWRYSYDHCRTLVARDDCTMQVLDCRYCGWRVDGHVVFVQQLCERGKCVVFWPNTLRPAMRDYREPSTWHATGKLITVTSDNIYEVLILLKHNRGENGGN